MDDTYPKSISENELQTAQFAPQYHVHAQEPIEPIATTTTLPHHPAATETSTGIGTKLIWGIFAVLTIALAVFFLRYPPLNYGGDIAEYHGITESLIKDGKIYLTDTAAYNIKTYLQEAYLHDPGYYVAGRDGHRWPVHFIFYSLLAMPVRVVLKLLQINELDTLRMANLVMFSLAAWYIMKTYLKTSYKKSVLLGALYLSPLVWFIYWPGADVYYTVLLMIALFLFGSKRYIAAAVTVALSSWHSQPLMVLVAAALAYYGYSKLMFTKHGNETHVSIAPKAILVAIGVAALSFVPYLYNYYAFGVLTPWTIFQDGWTQINGFGMQNISLWKLYEQFFDLNVGLIWYASIMLLFGVYAAIKSGFSDKRMWLLLTAMIGTAFFYQTNPAWHYGTAGYGPTRHVLFVVPFLIFFIVNYIQPKISHYVVLTLIVITQIIVMSQNGFLTPKLDNTLVNSPLATYVLKNYPKYYNPTPEIFVDRTNHTDLGYLQTAAFRRDGATGPCTKAFVLVTEKALLEKYCGTTPAGYDGKFTNEYRTKSLVSRTAPVLEATFWPDAASCGKDYVPSQTSPYVCMKTLDQAAKGFGVDSSRLTKVKDFPYPGIWKVKFGTPTKVTVPPGYVMDGTILQGFYVNYK